MMGARYGTTTTTMRKWIRRGGARGEGGRGRRRREDVRMNSASEQAGADVGVQKMRDRVLELVDDTDRGTKATPEQKREIASAIDELQAEAKDSSVSSYLEDERIYPELSVIIHIQILHHPFHGKLQQHFETFFQD